MKRTQKFRLYIAGIAILLGGSLAWASAAWLGSSSNQNGIISNSSLKDAAARFIEGSEELAYLYNPHFTMDEVIEDGIATYDYDMERVIGANGENVVHYGMQPVTNWTAIAPSTNIVGDGNNARACGVFAVGSKAFLAGADFCPPTEMPNGDTTGNLLGILAVWGATAQYTQDVSLPAGKYTMTFSYYNTGGTGTVSKNLMGYVTDAGVEFLGKRTSFVVGRWMQETVSFELEERTSGKFTLGYESANSGSGSMPHLYLDGITLREGISGEESGEESGEVTSLWTAPEAPSVQSADIEDGGIYYIYHVGTGQFMTGANSWATQISVTSTGVPQISLVAEQATAMDYNFETEYEEEITGYMLRLNGTFKLTGNMTATKTDTYLFRNDETYGFVDLGNQDRNHVWRFTKDENGLYNIQSTYEHGLFYDASSQYAYVGAAGKPVQFNVYKDDVEDVRFIEWALFPVDGSDEILADLSAKKSLYNARLALYETLNEALLEGVDYTEASKIYESEDATEAEILAANVHLQANIARARYAEVLDGVSEDNPMDITNMILKNADFSDSNINGWTCTFIKGVTATNIGYQGASYENRGDTLTGSAVNEYGDTVSISRFIEAWMQSTSIGDGELYQTVYGLPAGVYRLACDAISVDQLTGNNPVKGVQIYIATETGLETFRDIATNSGSPEHFSVSFISDGSDALTFGLRARNATANWIAADNFRVIFYGKVSSVGAAYLKNMIASVEIDTDIPCNRTVKDAYLAQLEASQAMLADETVPSDTCIAQADRLKASYDILKASIADYETFDAKYEEASTFAGKADELGNATLTAALTNLLDAFVTGYQEGTLTSEDFVSLYDRARALVHNVLITDMQPGSDLTLLIEDPDFSALGKGWISGNAAVNYHYGSAEVYHGIFDYHQILKNMPAGVYNLSVTAFNRMDADERTARLYGGISENRVKLITDEGSKYALFGDIEEEDEEGNVFASTTATHPYDRKNYNIVGAEGQLRFVPNSMEGFGHYASTINPETGLPYYTATVQIVLPEQGDLRIGIKAESKTEWTIWDNFHLEYAGNHTDLLAEAVANIQPYLADSVHYISNLRDNATGYFNKAEQGFSNASEAYTLIAQINNIIDSIEVSIEKYQVLANAIAITEERIANTKNLDETVAETVNALLVEARTGYTAGSYTDEEAVSVANELLNLSRRLQSGYLIIDLAQAGTLGDIVLDEVENFSDVKGLTVSGPMNSDDMENIKRMTALQELDLTNAGLTSIAGSQFYSNDVLKTVKLPTALTSIGSYAFYDCDSLTYVEVNGSSPSVESCVFDNCNALQEVVINEGITTIGSYMFRDCTNLTKVSLPQSLRSINNSAFYNCYYLTSFSLPKNLRSIGNYAFGRDYTSTYYDDYDEYGNYVYSEITYPSIHSIKFPSTLTSIGSYAFRNNAELSSVQFSEGLSTIDSYAFYGTKVTSATLPSTLTSIGYYVFNSADSIILKALVPPTSNNGDIAQNYGKLYVPSPVVKTYKQTNYWSKFSIVGINEMPQYINVEKALRLELNDSTLADYKPDYVHIWGTSTYVKNTGTPTTLGALEIRNNSVLSSKMLIIDWNPAQTNYYRYNWGSSTSYLPQHATLIGNGTMRADSVEVWMQVTDGQWNFISLPYDVRVGSIISSTGSANWVIRRYDGEARAAANMSNTWVNMSADDILEAGKGYILHCSYNPGSYYNSNVLWFGFPALNNANKNRIFTTGDRAVALAEYESEFAHNRSWNLVGNPYPAYISINSTDFTAPITVWSAGSYTAYSPLDDEYILSPGEAFFVQRPLDKSVIAFHANGRMNWYDASGNNNNYVRAEMSNTQSDRSVFNLTLSDGTHSDRTRVVLNNSANMGYEVDKDAAKFMNMDATVPMLYTVLDGVEYAINERPVSDGLVQLVARVAKAGTYTLQLQTRTGQSVLLEDTMTGTLTELNDGEEYTFEAESGSTGARFVLHFADATAIQQVEGETLADAEIYTLDGRRVNHAVRGTYIVRRGQRVNKVMVK